MFRKIAEFFAFKLFRFSLEGEFPKDPKFIIAVVPHTSNWDFIVAIGIRTYLKEPIHFVGKKELFTPLTSRFFKNLGGMPLNRNRNEQVVDAIARMCQEESVFRMAIAPEGTRKKVSKWKTGFYYIARKAQVDILPVALDWNRRVMTFHPLFTPTGDIKKDFIYLRSLFKDASGKIKEYTTVY